MSCSGQLKSDVLLHFRFPLSPQMTRLSENLQCKYSSYLTFGLTLYTSLMKKYIYNYTPRRGAYWYNISFLFRQSVIYETPYCVQSVQSIQSVFVCVCVYRMYGLYSFTSLKFDSPLFALTSKDLLNQST